MLSRSKVAIIGPQDSVLSCIAESGSYPQLDLCGFEYESEKETIEIVRSLGEGFDAVLFTGPIPYYMTTGMDELLHVPTLHIPFNGLGLYRALFQVRHIGDFTKVSIDTIQSNEVAIAYQELHLPTPSTYVLEYTHVLTSDEIVSFHKKLYKRGETAVALTCLRSSYTKLARLGVPVVRIIAGPSVIRETLDKIVLITESIWNKGRHISVGFISVNGYNAWRSDKGVYDIQKFHLQLNQSIFNYVKKLDGHFIETSPGEFVFFTTRIMVEKTTHQFTTSPIMEETIYLQPGLSLSVGIGFGATANLATDHARVALEKAKNVEGGSSYIMTEEGQLIGPLGNERENSIEQLRITDQSLMEVAKSTGLSAVLVNRLISSVRYVGETFTANDLAPFLGITVRSTRRLVNHLENAKIIEVVGQESVHERGKPRRVYKLR